MKIIEKRTPDKLEKLQLFELWNTEYPEALQFNNYEALSEYLEGLTKPNHIMVKNDDDQVIGWFFSFERDSDIWFGLLIHHKFQNKGLGKKLIKLVQSQYSKLNAWVVKDNNYRLYNGIAYKSPVDFYLKYGFNIIPNKYRKTDKINTIKIKWNRNS